MKAGVILDYGGFSGVDWKHYKHLLPESVYDVYMQHWEDTECAVAQEI